MIGYHPFPLIVLFQAPLAIIIHLYLLVTPSTWFLLVQDDIEFLQQEQEQQQQRGSGQDGGNDVGTTTWMGLPSLSSSSRTKTRSRDSLLPY